MAQDILGQGFSNGLSHKCPLRGNCWLLVLLYHGEPRVVWPAWILRYLHGRRYSDNPDVSRGAPPYLALSEACCMVWLFRGAKLSSHQVPWDPFPFVSLLKIWGFLWELHLLPYSLLYLQVLSFPDFLPSFSSPHSHSLSLLRATHILLLVWCGELNNSHF